MPEIVSWDGDTITDETSLRGESRHEKEGQTLGLCGRPATSPQGFPSLYVHEPPRPVGKESLCYLKTAFVAVSEASYGLCLKSHVFNRDPETQT